MQSKNHSEWRVETVMVVGRPFYRTYRILDESLPDAEENREYRGGSYYAISDAQRLAATLNRDEK